MAVRRHAGTPFHLVTAALLLWQCSQDSFQHGVRLPKRTFEVRLLRENAEKKKVWKRNKGNVSFLIVLWVDDGIL